MFPQTLVVKPARGDGCRGRARASQWVHVSVARARACARQVCVEARGPNGQGVRDDRKIGDASDRDEANSVNRA